MKVKYFAKFEERSTTYSIFVVDGNGGFRDLYGGRFMVSLFVGNEGYSYFLNAGFVHPTYLVEKYKNLTMGDAEIFSDYIENNKVLEDGS